MATLSGFFYDETGTALTGKTVERWFPAAASQGGAATATTTTDGNGQWTFTGVDEGAHDVRLTSGTQKRWIKGLTTPPGPVTPPGALSHYAGSVAPGGWLFCTGAAVSRTTYAALFAAIGTAYGVGDGVTTFNLPDGRGRVLAGLDNLGGVAAGRLVAAAASTLGGSAGAETHALTTAELATHTHGPGTLGGTVAAENATHIHGATGLTFAGSGLATHAHAGVVSQAGGHIHDVTGESGGLAGGTLHITPRSDGGGSVAAAAAALTNGLHQHTVTAESAGTPAGSVGGATATESASHAHAFTATTGLSASNGSGTPLTLTQPYLAVSIIVKT